MIKIKILTGLSLLIGLSSFGQIADSLVIKKIYTAKPKYELVAKKLTKQQYKAKVNFDKGYKFVGNSEFSKAIKFLRKAIALDSTGNCQSRNNGLAHSEIGYAYFRTGKIDLSKKYLRQAIEINKELNAPYLTLANIQSMIDKDDSSAIKTLSTVIKLKPDYLMALVQRGWIYKNIKEYNLALIDLNLLYIRKFTNPFELQRL